MVQCRENEAQLRSQFIQTQRLSATEAETDDILKNMLPPHVVPELKLGYSFVYGSYDMVSVLFTHVANFDLLTSSISAWALVNLLNDVFMEFDRLTDRFGVYKVETVGDVYLVCTGILHVTPPPALVNLDAAFSVLFLFL